MRKQIIILILFCSAQAIFSQENQKKISLNGYVSTMMSSMFDSLSGPFVNDYVIHNRLNFKAYFSENITFAAEFRNRLFVGDMVRSGLGYSDLIGADQGFADMSWNLIDKESFFLNTTADRLWLDLNYGKFQARIGRQRINWGQALVWNPNDIFNAYSFFDFDYPERPGSDAIRFQYYPGASSAIELAVKADNEKDITAAALGRFNKWGYDIQFLAGVSNSEELVAGAGWSGAFGPVSFRGEGTWFQPFAGGKGTGLLTAGADMIFSNNAMAQVQLMLCNKPAGFGNFTTLYSENLSAKDLAFSKFSAFGSFSYPVARLLTLGISSMWFPDLKGYFTGLSGELSVAENVDISLLWQHFRMKASAEKTRINLAFLRVKFSF